MARGNSEHSQVPHGRRRAFLHRSRDVSSPPGVNPQCRCLADASPGNQTVSVCVFVTCVSEQHCGPETEQENHKTQTTGPRTKARRGGGREGGGYEARADAE